MLLFSREKTESATIQKGVFYDIEWILKISNKIGMLENLSGFMTAKIEIILKNTGVLKNQSDREK